MVRLNLGCGSVKLDGYINIDLYKNSDLTHDLLKPLPFEEVDEIYTSHVVEHFTRKELKFLLSDWHRALKLGGTLTIICPEILASCGALLDGVIDIETFRLYVFGGQEDYGEGENHKNCFTLEDIKSRLDKFDIVEDGIDGGIIKIIATKK